MPLAAIVFHELAEAYSKVDLQKPYIDFELGMMLHGIIVATPTAFQRGAHNDAAAGDHSAKPEAGSQGDGAGRRHVDSGA